MEANFGRYYINEKGEVFSLFSKYGKRTRPLKLTPQARKDGYLQIRLRDEKGMSRMFLVHRIVAMTFIPNKFELPEVNHKDGDKTNNSVENLEWTTRSDNLRHRYRILGYATNTRKVKVECIETGEVFDSILNAAKSVDRKGCNISQALSLGCRCGGYHWKRI